MPTTNGSSSQSDSFRYLAKRLRRPRPASAIAGAMMGYHYVLIRGRSREGCFRAFRHNNWVGLAIFAGIVGSYHL